ncbi:hypothetical protein UlMin_039198 [Ulmus minor]
MRGAQELDPTLCRIREAVESGTNTEFSISTDGILSLKGRICIPEDKEAMGTKLKFSTAFHPQTDGQTERTIQTLEDMLRACVMEFKGGWSNRQKSYADRRRRPLEFKEGDYVFLKVAPMKGVMRFGKKGKLSPRFIGPFEILERIGKVAYKLALPSELAAVHNVFHVSMLRKYVSDPSHVLVSEPIEVREDLTYQEQPVQILDRKDKALRNKVIPLVKVLWRNHKVEEATWEREDEMRAKYPHLF